MSDTSSQDWTKPAAMAIPKGGFFPDKVEKGRYGPIFPRTPACYGFSILAKIVPGREDAVALFGATGITTVFENLEGFPKDWKTNAPAFIKFVREHHCPSFLEYGEYPFASAEEIKKALRVKASLSEMLDQMQ